MALVVFTAADADAAAIFDYLYARIRVGIASPYIVIYSHMEADDTVRVLRIVHGSRRITGKLLRGAS